MTASLSMAKFWSQSSLTRFAFPHSSLRGLEFLCLLVLCPAPPEGKNIPKGTVKITRGPGEFKSFLLSVASTISPKLSVGQGFRWETIETLVLRRLVSPFTAGTRSTKSLCGKKRKKEMCFSCIWQREKNTFTLK